MPSWKRFKNFLRRIFKKRRDPPPAPPPPPPPPPPRTPSLAASPFSTPSLRNTPRPPPSPPSPTTSSSLSPRPFSSSSSSFDSDIQSVRFSRQRLAAYRDRAMSILEKAHDECSNTHVPRRHLTTEECYICRDESLLSSCELPEVVWCKAGCGRSVHKTCFQAWRMVPRGRADEVTCPMCRAEWGRGCGCDRMAPERKGKGTVGE
ncbi:hypothetical protein M011DRAFT_476469 [Sporormia fimetaria CBS 119925]|uniref:RING-type domain-containing protein n=1 Tax=Sporormia fimetaria CBS 119925 TaxID=1340428 RepID=A0A6A6VFA1_9PLEO|nr:hypothetical protein M011DRAFT_476469 [Sporormia fimetaria CBS 119925]